MVTPMTWCEVTLCIPSLVLLHILSPPLPLYQRLCCLSSMVCIRALVDGFLQPEKEKASLTGDYPDSETPATSNGGNLNQPKSCALLRDYWALVTSCRALPEQESYGFLVGRVTPRPPPPPFIACSPPNRSE